MDRTEPVINKRAAYIRLSDTLESSRGIDIVELYTAIQPFVIVLLLLLLDILVRNFPEVILEKVAVLLCKFACHAYFDYK